MFRSSFFTLFLFAGFLCRAQTDTLSPFQGFVEEGINFHNQEKYDAALERYGKAGILGSEDPLEMAELFRLTGYTHYYKGDPSKALAYFKKATFRIKSDAPLYLEYVQMLNDIGQIAYFNQKQPVDTFCYYTEMAWKAAEQLYGITAPEYGYFMGENGLCKWEMGDSIGGRQIFQAAYGLISPKKKEHPFQYARISMMLGKAQYITGLTQEAVKVLSERLDFIKKLEPDNKVLLSENYYHLALAYVFGGQLSAGLPFWDTAFQLSPSTFREEEEAWIYYWAGEVAYKQKNFEEAKRLFFHAGAFLTDHKIEVPLEAAIWLFIASIYGGELKFVEALPYFEKACALAVKYYDADYPAAKEVCNMVKSLSYLKTGGFNLNNIVPTQSGNEAQPLIDVFTDILNSDRKVEMGTPQLTALFESARQNPEFMLLPQALLYTSQKEYPKAIRIIQQYYCKIIPGFEDSLDVSIDPPAEGALIHKNFVLLAMICKASALNLLAYEENKLDYLVQACRLYSKCDTLVTEIRLEADPADMENWSGLFSGLYSAWMDVAIRLATVGPPNFYKEQVFLASERLKGYSLLKTTDPEAIENLVPFTILAEEKNVRKEVLRLQRELGRSAAPFSPQAKKLSSYKDSLLLAQAQYRTIQSKLEADYPKYWQLRSNKRFAQLDEISKALNNRTGILSYTILNDNLVSIIFIHKGDVIFQISKSVTGLKNLVSVVSRYITNDQKNRDHKGFRNAAAILYHNLIPEMPTQIDRVVIIPDGYLHNLPFECLLTEPTSDNLPFSDYPFWIKKMAISYGYSVSLTLPLLNVKPNKYPKFFIGYGDGPMADFDSIQPLIKKAGLKYDWLNEAQTATKKDLTTRNLSEYQILHISGHGSEASAYSLAGIRLASRETVYFNDLYNLSFNSDLVLLLSCLSGKGEVFNGEGVIGLNRALHVAGAHNVLLYRYILEEEASAYFCQQFYTGLISGRQDYSRLMREATLKMIGSGHYADPAYWGGFYLIGI